MNYAVEQRLRMIDFLLNQYGKVNRKALMEYFGIGEASATRDFRLYEKKHPNNSVYDSSSKFYVKAPLFRKAY